MHAELVKTGPTGPRSIAGKAISSQNAWKHGLTAATFSLREWMKPAFEKFECDLRGLLKPADPLEEEIFQHAVQSGFNRRRAEALLDDLGSSESDPMGNDADARKYDRLDRYKLRYERAFYRALRELKILQTQRAERAKLPAEVAENIPPLADVRKYSKRTPPARLPDTFEGLCEEIEREFGFVGAETNSDPAPEPEESPTGRR